MTTRIAGLRRDVPESAGRAGRPCGLAARLRSGDLAARLRSGGLAARPGAGGLGPRLCAGRLLAALAAVLVGACASNPSVAPGTSADGAAASRQILLTVEQHDFSGLDLAGAPSKRYLLRRGYGAAPPSVDRLLDQLAKDHGISRKDGWPIESLEVYCEVFEVPDGVDVGGVIERLRADPRVDLAQPMNLFETLSRYDDPYADLQPGALELGVEQAHRFATGKGVLVAVIDTAVDTEHPDLKGRVGFVRDLVAARVKPAEAEVHGTAVAGVIASAINNNEGIVGIAPDVSLAALRACWTVGGEPGSARCSSFTLAQALEVALAVEPALINLSLAGPTDPLLSRLLDEAIGRGIVVVAAEPAASSSAVFPASHPGVIVAQASSAADEEPSPYRLPAPAEEILTTTPGASYAFFSGTSLAAAHLSGVIALLKERKPELGVHRIGEVLSSTTVHGDDAASVNACLALEALMSVHMCEERIETARFD